MLNKKHFFLSYCRDNQPDIAKLRDELIAAGEPVWWDQDILPGQTWELEIDKAIKAAYAVVLCLSKESQARATTGIYPEARNAIEAYRLYSPGDMFLIPVRLSDCEIPPFKIDATTKLDGLQFVDLFPPAQRAAGLAKLVKALQAAPHHPSRTPPDPVPHTTPRLAPTRLPNTGDFLMGREEELAMLFDAWNNGKTNIVQIVAPGGVGKTQLVKKWRQRLYEEGWLGAERVFDWSFYSQGTGQQGTADNFFSAALEWFGETRLEKYVDPWSKGERLAELVREQRTLLILDGLEPLQHPPGLPNSKPGWTHCPQQNLDTSPQRLGLGRR